MNNDLISREALKEKVALMWGDNNHITESMYEIIDNAPTVEVPTYTNLIEATQKGYNPARKLYEKPQGEWELSSIQVVGENWFKCSICGRKIRTSTYHLKEYPFCHCGADMRGNEE